MFKIQEDLNPEYMAVSFDLKAPTARHQMYSEYKANRHGMPNELAEQMPLIKDVLKAMNIDIVQKEGYEGDDILGTLAKYGESQGLEVVILSGDRDTFQLASDKTTIRIPRTKAGKTETEDYDRKKVEEEYGLEPKALIEVKGLQGDSSDNIPGVPGIGPKSAISIIQKYGTIENLYKAIDEEKDDLKGKQREAIVANKEMALLSKKLGTIDINVPLEENLETLKCEEWDRTKVLEIFKNLNFKRYIEKFDLENLNIENNEEKNEKPKELFTIEENIVENDIENMLKQTKKLIYFINTEKDENEEKILKEKIISISIYDEGKNIVYIIKKPNIQFLKSIFEDEQIEKYGFEMNKTYILLKEMGITIKSMRFDVAVAAYILNPTDGKYPIDKLLEDYLDITAKEEPKQMTLFDTNEEKGNNDSYSKALKVWGIYKLYKTLKEKLEEKDEWQLFETIDMPTIEVLGNMQWNGMYADSKELDEFGIKLKEGIDFLTNEIYNLAGEEFNIKSTKQLGELLFEKLKLPTVKKTKSGYSTDVDVLEKLRGEHPIIEKILDYRQLTKLNSTYVEGLKPFINPKTGRIHSFFHQTITATGRISSTDPNLQNIPTRIELGKQLRKIFKPENGNVYIDADYSQIELRVLAHLSGDKHMIEAFKNGEDIHRQAASKVFGIPQEEVTKEQRSNAKAVNFGIVYGISDFGLGQQLGISRKKAKEYIEQYLEQYSGVRNFMQSAIQTAKEKGYSETLFKRKREIRELSSNNYMVRQFGERAAMNTPVQGTAADIMKIAMIKVYNELKTRKMKAKIVLQVHDEMMIETPKEEIEEVKKLLKDCMENATKLEVPLIADVSVAENWYECK